MTRLCIFDLDGTLLNTLGGIRHYLNLALLQIGIAPVSEEQTRIFVGNGAAKLIERALRAAGKDTDTPEGRELYNSALSCFLSSYNADPNYLTDVYTGIPELLSALCERGIGLAVLSNKPHAAVEPLVRHYFGDVFSVMAGGRPGVPLKPAPDAVLSICREAGVDAADTAFIGDSDVDMMTAHAYGAGKAIGVLWGFRSREELLRCGADVTVSDPMDILDAI